MMPFIVIHRQTSTSEPIVHYKHSFLLDILPLFLFWTKACMNANVLMQLQLNDY